VLSQRYTRLVTTLLMSMVMVTLMTFVITAINAFPLIYVLPKRMQMLAGRICSLPY
jgi:hypothetical protein